MQQVNKTGVFNTGEFHTYFIPVDAGMQVISFTLFVEWDEKWQCVEVIAGRYIPQLTHAVQEGGEFPSPLLMRRIDDYRKNTQKLLGELTHDW